MSCRRTAQALELLGALRAAREMAGDATPRPACRRPSSRSKPSGSTAASLEELPRLSVFHRLPSPFPIRRLPAPRPVPDPPPGPSSSARTSRSRSRARRVLVFTVPSGQPSRSAISDLGQLRAVRQHERRPLGLRQLGQRIPDHAAKLRRRELALRPGAEVRPAEDGARGDEPLERRRVAVRPRRRPTTTGRGWAAGLPPAAGRRSGCGRSCGAMPRATRRVGLKSSARFQSARNVSWTTSSATCRSDVSRLAAA